MGYERKRLLMERFEREGERERERESRIGK
jgi:hypothetical protein